MRNILCRAEAGRKMARTKTNNPASFFRFPTERWARHSAALVNVSAARGRRTEINYVRQGARRSNSSPDADHNIVIREHRSHREQWCLRHALAL
jgi:hypothetical protein